MVFSLFMIYTYIFLNCVLVRSRSTGMVVFNYKDCNNTLQKTEGDSSTKFDVNFYVSLDDFFIYYFFCIVMQLGRIVLVHFALCYVVASRWATITTEVSSETFHI